MKLRHCELCSAAAAVYCPSDDAFLCRICDKTVHEANFLVARHVRRWVCSNCRNITGCESAGFVSLPPRGICHSCSPPSDGGGGDVSSGYSSCSSDCISSTTSPARQYSVDRGFGSLTTDESGERRRAGGSRRMAFAEAEGVFAEWCSRLGAVGADVAVAVQMACKGLRACSEGSTVVPYRVCLAASMWLGLRLGGNKSAATWQVLKRLEEVSCVPARVILAAELKLERGLRVARRRLNKLEEGWAEC